MEGIAVTLKVGDEKYQVGVCEHCVELYKKELPSVAVSDIISYEALEYLSMRGFNIGALVAVYRITNFEALEYSSKLGLSIGALVGVHGIFDFDAQED